MIGLDAPAALAGLLSLPLIVWLHRRRGRAALVTVPSLRFLPVEEDRDRAERRALPDLDLLLALAGAAALALAAASPTWTLGPAGRSVDVVVDVGPSMAARGADGSTAAARSERVVDAIRSRLRASDVFSRADASGPGIGRAASGGRAAVRVVVTDRARDDVGPGVVVAAVGEPSASNAGIVAATIERAVGSGPPRVFVAVWNHDPRPRRLRVAVDGGTHATLDAPADSAVSTFLALGSLDRAVAVRLDDPDGALAADDVVRLDPTALVVAIASPGDGLPPVYAAAIRRALDAAAPGWVEAFAADAERASVRFGAAPSAFPSGVDVVLRPLGDAAGVRPPAGAREEAAPLPWGRDLDATGVDRVYASAFPAGAPWAVVRVERGAGGATVVRFLPDPLAGTPSPADAPLWPLFVENVVEGAVGVPGGASRVQGVLDVEATRVGRDRVAFDGDVVDRAPADLPARTRSLRAPLLAAALGAWALLWWRPRRESRA